MNELNRRIELEALIAEREGMVAINADRAICGGSMAYVEEAFWAIAQKMRALADPERTLCPGEDLRDCGRPEPAPSYTPDDVARLEGAAQEAMVALAQIMFPNLYSGRRDIPELHDRIVLALAPFKEKA